MATANEENLRISIAYIIVEQRVMVPGGRRYCRGHGRSLDDQREDALREFAERVAEFCAAHIDNADPNAADKIRDAFGFRNREARCEEIVDGYRRLRKAERLKEEPQHQEQTMCGRYKHPGPLLTRALSEAHADEEAFVVTPAA